MSEESPEATARGQKWSYVFFGLLMFGIATPLLYPSLSEEYKQGEIFKASFKDTYDVDRTVETKYGFNVYLHDNTELDCDKPTLAQVESRVSVKCTNSAKENSAFTLEPKVK